MSGGCDLHAQGGCEDELADGGGEGGEEGVEWLQVSHISRQSVAGRAWRFWGNGEREMG